MEEGEGEGEESRFLFLIPVLCSASFLGGMGYFKLSYGL